MRSVHCRAWSAVPVRPVPPCLPCSAGLDEIKKHDGERDGERDGEEMEMRGDGDVIGQTRQR